MVLKSYKAMFRNMLVRAVFYIFVLLHISVGGALNAGVRDINARYVTTNAVSSLKHYSRELYSNAYRKTLPASFLVLNHYGQTLYEKNADTKMFPASLTKLMTVYVVLEAVKQGKLSFNTQLVTSKNATSMPASKLWLKEGDHISVREALLSLLIKSCNDVSVVLAEGYSGTEDRFAKLMNAKAVELGMYNTHFENASGWHHPDQVTTAHDMAKLILALVRDFPQYNYLFSINSFLYKQSLYKNTNPVRRNLKGVDAIKTGYTNPAGWNIVTTARRGNTRLVGVILGENSHFARDRNMLKLMERYFTLSTLRAGNKQNPAVKYG